MFIYAYVCMYMHLSCLVLSCLVLSRLVLSCVTLVACFVFLCCVVSCVWRGVSLCCLLSVVCVVLCCVLCCVVLCVCVFVSADEPHRISKRTSLKRRPRHSQCVFVFVLGCLVRFHCLAVWFVCLFGFAWACVCWEGERVYASNAPPCVRSKRFRVYRQQAHMFHTCGLGAGTHAGVLNVHTEAF